MPNCYSLIIVVVHAETDGRNVDYNLYRDPLLSGRIAFCCDIAHFSSLYMRNLLYHYIT